MSSFAKVLEKLVHLSDLDREEMQIFLNSIFAQSITEVEMAAALALLRAKGESFVEIATAAECMLGRGKAFESPRYPFADIVGTGGDGHQTINISTGASLVCAGAGLPVAKHGSVGVSSLCGSANVLEALGVKLEVSPERARVCLDEASFCFLFAPYYHPSFAVVRPMRRALKMRTMFNLLGPLLNPARPSYQVIGVFDAKYCEPMAKALSLLGCKKAAVIHGSGLDEVALHGPTTGVLLENGKLVPLTLEAKDFGLSEVPIEALRGGNVEENAQYLKDVLKGGGNPAHRAAICANAGLLLWISEHSNSLKEAVQKAENAIDSGSVLEKLRHIGEITNA